MIHLYTFFNTNVKDSGIFAAMGNAGLMPIRYLCNGKKIQIDANDQTVTVHHVASFHKKGSGHFSKTEPSLRSDSISMLRTVLAVVFIFPGIIVAAATKGFSYLFSSIREKHHIVVDFLQSREETNGKIGVIKEIFKDEVAQLIPVKKLADLFIELEELRNQNPRKKRIEELERLLKKEQNQERVEELETLRKEEPISQQRIKITSMKSLVIHGENLVIDTKGNSGQLLAEQIIDSICKLNPKKLILNSVVIVDRPGTKSDKLLRSRKWAAEIKIVKSTMAEAIKTASELPLERRWFHYKTYHQILSVSDATLVMSPTPLSADEEANAALSSLEQKITKLEEVVRAVEEDQGKAIESNSQNDAQNQTAV